VPPTPAVVLFGERLVARKVSGWVPVPLVRAEPCVRSNDGAEKSGANRNDGFRHDGPRTPGPSPPVATTRDDDAVNEHGRSVANRRPSSAWRRQRAPSDFV